MRKLALLFATLVATLALVPAAGAVVGPNMPGDPGGGTCYYIWSWSPTAGWFVSGIHCY